MVIITDKLKYLSLFSGIGGFEYGIQQSNIPMECVGYAEIDKYARSIYERKYPKHFNWGDVTQIRTDELPDFDFLVGGFPCQAFSHAGLRRGFDDTRGTLFFEIARILKDKRPTYFLLENVKGLLSHEKGETFKRILEILTSLGYNVKWEIFNSKDYGVPQNRERVFIEGYSRGECGSKVLSVRRKEAKTLGRISNTYFGVRTGRIHKEDELMNTLTTTGQNCGGRQLVALNNKAQAQKIYDSNGLSVTLSANGGGDGGKTGLYLVSSDNNDSDRKIKKVGNTSPSNHWRSNVYDSNGISPALTSCDYKLPRQIIVKNEDDNLETDENCVCEDDRKIKVVGNLSPTNHHVENVLSVDGISHTLNATNYKHPLKIKETTKKGYKEAYPNDGVLLNRTGRKIMKGMVHKDSTGTLSTHPNWGTVTEDYQVRRLTPVECERLQGFPDNYTKYGVDDELISDTQRYKCLGNAVTTTVITFIINEMFGDLIEE